MITDMVSVDVVLPTYNGAAFLGTQLGSLQQQTLLPRRVLLRDDGSTDSTALILRRWARSWPAIEVLDTDGMQHGVTHSFAHLLRHVAEGADVPDLLAFCDQDDEWFPDKLGRAAQWHAGLADDRPALYCSAAIITDERLKPVGRSPRWRKPPSFKNALVENISLGCTIVLNRPAIDLLNRPWPSAVIAHDWWAYLVVTAAGGHVHFDPEPTLNYRQHGRNAVGMGHSAAAQTVRRIKRVLSGQVPPVMSQAKALSKVYADVLKLETAQILGQFTNVQVSVSDRISGLVTPSVHRQRLIDNLLLRMMMGFGTLK